jgi:hypothetical protein
MYVDKSYWGIQGFEIMVGNTGADSGECFLVQPSYINPVTVHHVIFANNVANGCYYGGFIANSYSATASVDYLAIIGNIAYNAAQGSAYCFSGISVYQPAQSDSVAGTHILIAGNYSYANTDPNPCGGTAPTDGEGIILDTFDGSNGMRSPYCAQALVENNIAVFNGGKGIHVFQNNASSCQGAIYMKYNTAYGNYDDPYMGYCADSAGEMTIVEAYKTVAEYNLLQTASANGCGGYPRYAFIVSGGNKTDTVTYNYMSGVSGNNTVATSSPGFSYGTNTVGKNPTFLNPVQPSAPSCGAYGSVPACMAKVIADYTPTVEAALAYGRQTPGNNSYDPLYPQWLCNVTLPPGLITQGCKN